jgi:O-antigen ligase
MPPSNPPSAVRDRFFTAALAVCLLLPWLNGYYAGPIANFWPWLVSAICGVFVALGWGRVSARLLAFTWLAAALISCLMALLQYFGLAAALAPWLSPTMAGEAFANLRQRNLFATLTSLGLVALLATVALQKTSMLSVESVQPTQRRIPAWAYASALLLALGNAASSSRTGLLEWALVLVLSLWWHRASRRPLASLALLALLMYGAAVVVLPLLLELVTGISAQGLLGRLADAGSDSRRVLWDNVLTLIAQKPWLGWGWGELGYAHFITAYPGTRSTVFFDNAHNLPLQLAVEMGVPMALLTCAGLAWAVLRAKPWLDTDPARQMAWAVLAVIGVHSLLEYPLWFGPFQLALLCCVAWLWQTRQIPPAQRYRSSSGHTNQKGKTIWLAGKKSHIAAVATLLALVYAGFDYVRVTQLYVPSAMRWPAYKQNTLAKVQDSWLFAPQVLFAVLMTNKVTPANASAMQALALTVLHNSAEAKVVEKLITSALLSGQRADAEFYMARFRWAYPQDYAVWAKANTALIDASAVR